MSVTGYLTVNDRDALSGQLNFNRLSGNGNIFFTIIPTRPHTEADGDLVVIWW
jgi:hypothetical protein